MLPHINKKQLNFALPLLELFIHYLNLTGQKLSYWLESTSEIKVKQIIKTDNIYWRAYNPVTGQSFCSGNELEIQAWIEQQIYN